MKSVFKFLNTVVDIIYPRVCLVCRTPLKDRACVDATVCLECWSKIKINAPPFCNRCGRHLEKTHLAKNICPSCIRNELHFDRAFSPCKYDGIIKELIHEFKYKGKDHIGLTLSKLMIDFIKEYDLPLEYLDYIAPVPLHKTKLREREFNQAEILGRNIASYFNKNLLKDALVRNRFTKTQTELEHQERLQNIQGCFTVARGADIKGKNILLIDDVLTSAATASEAALTLKKSGANIVFVLTLAN